MESRFTFKDFFFTILLLVVVGCVVLAMWQFSYQEQRLTAVQDEVKKLNDISRQQLAVLEGLRQDLRSAPRVAVQGSGASGAATQSAATQTAENGVVRRKTPDGGLYVYAAVPPRTSRDPHTFADYTPGDWVIRALGSEPAIVTPYISRDAYGKIVQDQVLESLVTMDLESAEQVPWLAESYEISADGTTYRFVLRKNVNFSDGSPVKMSDVLFSYNTLMNPKIEAGPIQSYFTAVESVKALDDYTLEVKFKEPYFQALEIAGGVPIIPEHVYRYKDPEEFNKRTDTLVGTGPYIFNPKDWVKGQQIVLTRNDSYWGDKGVFDRVVLRIIPNPQASFQALQAGQIDYMGPQPDQFVKYSKDPEFTSKFTVYKYENALAGYAYMGYNLNNPLFKDKLTRQALTQLLDRESICNTIGQGLWKPCAGPFSPFSRQIPPDLKPWPYDVAEAQRKLQEVGWKRNANGILERNGTPFRFTINMPSQNSVYERIGSYIKEQYAKVGIDVTISPLEFSVMIDRLDNRQFDAAILGWGGGSPEDDPYQIWHSKSIENKGSNFISYRNPETDQILETARREMDAGKRMALWHKFSRIIHEDEPYTFLHSGYATLFVDKRFENSKPYKYDMYSVFAHWYVPAAKQKYR